MSRSEKKKFDELISKKHFVNEISYETQIIRLQ